MIERWPIAANEPSAIEPIETKMKICCQIAVTSGSAPMKTRTVIETAAIFGAEAKKAVTGVGEPS